jgi:hypothetical protein
LVFLPGAFLIGLALPTVQRIPIAIKSSVNVSQENCSTVGSLSESPMSMVIAKIALISISSCRYRD